MATIRKKSTSSTADWSCIVYDLLTGLLWNFDTTTLEYDESNWSDYMVELTGSGNLYSASADLPDGNLRIVFYNAAYDEVDQDTEADSYRDVSVLNNEFVNTLTAQGYTDVRGAKLDNLDATVSSRSSHTAAQAGTDAASKVLATPANKLVTDGDGYVTAENMRGTDSANTVAPLDAAGVRTAVGLASADLDTQLADLPTVAEFEARTLVAADYFVVGDYTAPDNTNIGISAVAAAAAASSSAAVEAKLPSRDYLAGSDVATGAIASADKTGYALSATGLDAINIDDTATITLSPTTYFDIVYNALAGNASYDADTGLWTIKKADGTTRTIVTITGEGDHTGVLS